MLQACLQRIAWNVRSSDDERHFDVELIRKCFALHHSVLAQVVAVVGGVDDVGVVQLTHAPQQPVYLCGMLP